MSAAREIVAALGGRWHGSYGMALCPAHDDGTSPALSIRDGVDQPVIVKCHAGCDQRAVIDALKARNLWPEPDAPIQAPRKRQVDPDRTEQALNLWIAAKPIEGTPAEDYLRYRRITIDLPCSLRFGRMKHGPTGLTLPAMIGAVQHGDRKIRAVHRTFVTETGRKQPLSNPKLALGPLADGAVRLAAAGETLGLAEGIETALSAMQMFDVPVWAALGSRLDAIALPDRVKHVIIFADSGEAGARAAERARARYVRDGKKVTVETPKAGDWNDLLQERRAADGAP